MCRGRCFGATTDGGWTGCATRRRPRPEGRGAAGVAGVL